MFHLHSYLNNNKIAYYNGASPFKPETMTQGSVLTNSKHSYIRKGFGGDSSSSDITAKKRIIAIGKNMSRIGPNQITATSYATINNNDVRHTLSKVRGSGYISPRKKGFRV